MANVEHAYVPTVSRVRQAITSLVGLNAHRSVAGYLCVLNAASQARRVNDLRPDFKAFFDRFFRIAHAPEKKPYAVPFTTGAKSILFNANVAGSYAPSSIRAVSPLHGVMSIEGGGQAVFSLRPEHAQIARDVLLPSPLPIYALATFFYRDVGFTNAPSREDIENAVKADFGYAIHQDLYGSGLFADDLDDASSADFEVVEAAA